MDQKLPVPIVNVAATPLPFCVPLLLAGCQSWKNWLGIVVKLWIWSGSIIGCQFSHVPRRMHCKSFFKTVYPSHKSLYTAHQQFQLVNYVQAHQMFTIDLGTLSFYMTTWLFQAARLCICISSLQSQNIDDTSWEPGLLPPRYVWGVRAFRKFN
jgi:hypothetical protein